MLAQKGNNFNVQITECWFNKLECYSFKGIVIKTFLKECLMTFTWENKQIWGGKQNTKCIQLFKGKMPCNIKDTLIAISNYKEEKITKIFLQHLITKKKKKTQKTQNDRITLYKINNEGGLQMTVVSQNGSSSNRKLWRGQWAWVCVTLSFKQFYVGLVVSISLCIRCLPRCLPAHCLVSPSSNLVS